MIETIQESQKTSVEFARRSGRYTHLQDIMRSFKREPYTQDELGLVSFSLTTATKKSINAEPGRPAGDHGVFTLESRSDDYRRLTNVGVCIFTLSQSEVMEIVVIKFLEVEGPLKRKQVAFRVFVRTIGDDFTDLGRAPSLSLALKLAKNIVQNPADRSPS
jgi:hypothetical protein